MSREQHENGANNGAVMAQPMGAEGRSAPLRHSPQQSWGGMATEGGAPFRPEGKNGAVNGAHNGANVPQFGPDMSVSPKVSLRREVARWLRTREAASGTVCEIGSKKAFRASPEAEASRMEWFRAEAEEAGRLAARLEASAS